MDFMYMIRWISSLLISHEFSILFRPFYIIIKSCVKYTILLIFSIETIISPPLYPAYKPLSSR